MAGNSIQFQRDSTHSEHWINEQSTVTWLTHWNPIRIDTIKVDRGVRISLFFLFARFDKTKPNDEKFNWKMCVCLRLCSQLFFGWFVLRFCWFFWFRLKKYLFKDTAKRRDDILREELGVGAANVLHDRVDQVQNGQLHLRLDLHCFTKLLFVVFSPFISFFNPKMFFCVQLEDIVHLLATPNNSGMAGWRGIGPHNHHNNNNNPSQPDKTVRPICWPLSV